MAQKATPETYRELFEAFLTGATEGRHRRIAIEEESDRTLLVAYGWCLYAEREKDTGKVTAYTGWATGRATNASNLQAGRMNSANKVGLLGLLDEQSMFHQVAMQERVDALVTREGNEIEQFHINMVPTSQQ